MKANEDFLDPRKTFWSHAKKFDPRKNMFDPRYPSKYYDPRKMLIHVRNILTHVADAIHVKF